jgi:hypothetical protein
LSGAVTFLHMLGSEQNAARPGRDRLVFFPLIVGYLRPDLMS